MQNPNSQLSNLSSSDFEFITKLGKGSFGVVHKVRRKSNRSIYVLKQINISGFKSKMKAIALNEVKVLKSLDNPYIVKYYDSFLEKDQLSIVMEYCEGGDLSQYIKAHFGKSVPEAKIWKFLIQMCIGLEYIHSKKILHRDIKSLNIFLTKDGDIRIGDLGVAKVMAETASFAHTIIGTPYYLSPEMCEEKPYNEKSDIWALGCVLYELCVQKHPFQAQKQETLLLKIIKGRYNPIPGTFSPELSEIVNLCLNKDYKKRPTARALLSKSSIIEKARSLGISLQPQTSSQKEKELIQKKDDLPPKEVRKEERNESKPKLPENKDGKINIFFKNELPKAVIGEDLPLKSENENKNIHNVKAAAANQVEVKKYEAIKPNPDMKAAHKNEKIEPIKLQKHKENPIGPEVVAKAVNDGKKAPYFVVNAERKVNKEDPALEKGGLKDDRNVQRVRKGAPNDLGRFAKNVGIQQRLVKKVNLEPPKINRPSVNEIQKVKLESNRPSEKRLPEPEKIEITEDELNQVKNLPDVVIRAQSLKENPKAPIVIVATKEEDEDLRQKNKEPQGIIQKPTIIQNKLPSKEEAKPTSQKSSLDLKVEKQVKADEQVTIAQSKPKDENREVVERGGEGQENKSPENKKKQEEKFVKKDNFMKDQKPIEEHNEEVKVEQEIVIKDRSKQRGFYNEVSTPQGIANQEGEEQMFEYEESEEENDEVCEEETQDETEKVESNQEDSSDEEEDQGDGNNPDWLTESQRKIKETPHEVLTYKVQKFQKKKEKIQELIQNIMSLNEIRALGSDNFREIINFFKQKLESEEEIDEDDQDEIEDFLHDKLNPSSKVQVVYNIYKLLGLQIELQKCEKDLERYRIALA